MRMYVFQYANLYKTGFVCIRVFYAHVSYKENDATFMTNEGLHSIIPSQHALPIEWLESVHISKKKIYVCIVA